MYKSVISFGVFAVILNNVQTITEKRQTEIQKRIMEFGAECMKKNPVSYEELLTLRLRIFPDNEKVGCFAACVFQRVGLFDDEGKLASPGAIHDSKRISGNKEETKAIEKFLVECSKVNDEPIKSGKPTCKRAKLAFNCYVSNYEKFSFDMSF